MSLYKKRKILWILKHFPKEIARMIELTHLIYEKYGDLDFGEYPETDEFVSEGYNILDKLIESVRDQSICSPKIARRYVFDTIRLHKRGKI